MKKSKIVRLFLVFVALGIRAATLLAVYSEERRFTPYFNMGVSQGAYIPSKGSFFAGANINASVGLLTKLVERHSLFSLYDLTFAGEGFRFQDTQEFATKDLLHNFNLEYRWQVWDWFRVRPGVSYGLNFTRTATGEIWGNGLYDNKSIGGQLSLDFSSELWEKKFRGGFQYTYRDFAYPNYTDIIREFQGLGTNVELSGGLKDQGFHEFGFSVYWNKIFGRFQYNMLRFKNEKVVESNGSYGSTPQSDSSIILSAGLDRNLWRFEIFPEVSFKVYDSNQNFLLFKSVTDSAPTFAANYYDYTELAFSVPLFLNLTESWALNTALDYRRRSYVDRKPRNEANNFVEGGTQKNNMVVFTAGFRKKLNDISAMTLTYSSVVAISNNTFERYLPYNYSGQKIAVSYNITY